MVFSDFMLLLEKRLQLPLPGLPSQLKMSSMNRYRELTRFTIPEAARQSSVLILLFLRDNQIYFVLMQRPEYKGVHSGQISLPGGKSEETDESLIYTALREAQEEIGVESSRVQIIGQLTELYIPPSNFLVTPVVGYLAKSPQFSPDPSEVARIIEVKMTDLLIDAHVQMKTIRLPQGLPMEVPSFFIEGNVIWGATAMILSELKDIINEITKV